MIANKLKYTFDKESLEILLWITIELNNDLGCAWVIEPPPFEPEHGELQNYEMVWAERQLSVWLVCSPLYTRDIVDKTHVHVFAIQKSS